MTLGRVEGQGPADLGKILVHRHESPDQVEVPTPEGEGFPDPEAAEGEERHQEVMGCSRAADQAGGFQRREDVRLGLRHPRQPDPTALITPEDSP